MEEQEKDVLDVYIVKEAFSVEEMEKFKTDNPQFDYNLTPVLGTVFEITNNLQEEKFRTTFYCVDSKDKRVIFDIIDEDYNPIEVSDDSKSLAYHVCRDYFINHFVPLLKEFGKENVA